MSRIHERSAAAADSSTLAHTHTNSSAQSPATRSPTNTQIVEATLETENVTRVYTLPHRNEIPHEKQQQQTNITNTQHLSVRAARTLSVQFGLVLLRSVNFDFFITTNFFVLLNLKFS